MLSSPARLVCVTVIALLLACSAEAQKRPDISAQPLYETINLQAGFSPDPYSIEITAGGPDRNAIQGSGCVGYLNASRPDLDLNYSAGSFPLSILANSETDTALLVNLPDGSWICDDDSGDGSNPMLRLPNPQSGNYNIWLATYSENAQARSTVVITERSESSEASVATASTGTSAGTTMPDVGAQPLYGTVSLQSGFAPDPHVTAVDAGGSDPNPISGSGCAGYINADQPDLDLNYESGAYGLYLSVRSSSDTTLLVNLPDGSWVCSDDAVGRDPMIALERPMSGNYNVWVGTYAAGGTQNASILISERDPR